MFYCKKHGLYFCEAHREECIGNNMCHINMVESTLIDNLRECVVCTGVLAPKVRFNKQGVMNAKCEQDKAGISYGQQLWISAWC